MRCPSCATELLHAANFCPVCGFHFVVPAAPQQVQPQSQAQQPVEQPQTAQPAQPTTPLSPPPPPAPGQRGMVGGGTTNVLGELVDADYFASGNAYEPPRVRRRVAPAAHLLAFATFCLLAVAIAVYAAELRIHNGGAMGGLFVLLASICWVAYLSLPEIDRHERLSRQWLQLSQRIDRIVQPLRHRAGVEVVLRRSRDMYGAMQSERARRVGALGEAAYRAYRSGGLPDTLHEPATRVMAIERQMLAQDQQLRALTAQRHRPQHEDEGDS